MSKLSADQVAQLAMDLAPFADIGTEAPAVQHVNGEYIIRLVRMGDPTELSIKAATGELVERIADQTIKHVHIRALLASDRYGSLSGWGFWTKLTRGEPK